MLKIISYFWELMLTCSILYDTFMARNKISKLCSIIFLQVCSLTEIDKFSKTHIGPIVQNNGPYKELFRRR